MKKRFLSILLVFVLLVSILPVPALATIDMTGNGTSSVISKREYEIAEGISETDLVLNTPDGSCQNEAYVMELDLSVATVSIRAGYKDYDGTVNGMQTCTAQAAAAEAVLQQTDPDTRVVGVVNANFFDMSNGAPKGALVMNGVVCHDTEPGYPYFCILDDGTAEIRDASVPVDSHVVEAMGGSTILAAGGVNLISGTNSAYVDTDQPRTAVGIRADGTVVLLVVDGRQAPTSSGMSFAELADTMLAMGCETVLNLDGGGSTTFATERKGTSELTVYNSPSGGYQRQVSGTLLVTTTEPVDPDYVYDSCAHGDHDYRYSRSTGILTCSNCGITMNAVAEQYSDFAKDADTGKTMYLVAGVPQTGFQYTHGRRYYFDSNGLAFEGNYTMCGEICTFSDGIFAESLNSNVAYAGLAGPSVNFVVYKDGRLVLQGSGETYTNATSGTIPWYNYVYAISSISVGAGITGLGGGTFCLSSEKAVAFESGSQLTKISAYAFSGNTSLTSIVLPDGVKTIGSRAFGDDAKLQFVYLPSSVAAISSDAFYKCSKVVLSVAPGSYAETWAKANGVSYLVRNACSTHTWSDWNSSQAKAGYQWHYCTVCGSVETDLLYDNPFRDTEEGVYYFIPVLWAADGGITNGTTSQTFSPNAGCTRAQIVTFLWRAAGKPEPETTENPFTDVSESDYYYKAVLWAVEKGITNGTTETTFSPNASCTRAQAVTFMWRAAGKPAIEYIDNPFRDMGSSDYYYDAVLWAVRSGITNGTSSTGFSPNKGCTRGQIVTFLYRYLVTDNGSF